MSRSIAKRYASALFELADESYQIDKVVVDLDLIHQAFLDSEDFARFIKNPIIPYEKQVDVLEQLFSKKIQKVTFEFLKLLAKKERLDLLDFVALEFKTFVQESQGVIEAEVFAAQKLSAEQEKDIKNQLKKRLDKKVDLLVTVDEDMLGGFKVKIGDEILDYSLDHQLRDFKDAVLKG